MLRCLARTPGATRDNKDFLLLSFSPSTGNISVVKEIVDKLLKGYDVRLRPDFGGTERAGRGQRGRGCSVCLCWHLGHSQHAQTSGTAPTRRLQPQPSRPCCLLPHISFTPPAFPSPLTGSCPSTIAHLCRQLGCPWCDVSGDILPQQRHSALP